jgi:hypothetical protein
MPAFICETCGTQFPPADAPPPACPICIDPRQYVNPAGQSWTTLEKLAQKHGNAFRRHEMDLYEIRTRPDFGIGQRAFLLRTPHGNLLWDCIALLDGATIDLIRALGGLTGIAISHPHYYTTMAEWSRAFGDVPIHLHAADRQWVMRADPAIRFWDGDMMQIEPGLTLIRCGGHFAGGTVLHWASGSDGSGVLLSGDILQVVPDRAHVSFMRSYPNLWPLSAPAVERIAALLEPIAYDRVYGAFAGREITSGGKRAVAESVTRYLDAIRGDGRAELN